MNGGGWYRTLNTLTRLCTVCMPYLINVWTGNYKFGLAFYVNLHKDGHSQLSRVPDSIMFFLKNNYVCIDVVLKKNQEGVK